MQVKLISNKRVETIIDAIKNTWNMNVGLPLVGFFADNGGEFVTIKKDKLTSKL